MRTRLTTLKPCLLEAEATRLDTGRTRYIPQLLGDGLDEPENLKRDKTVSLPRWLLLSEIVESGFVRAAMIARERVKFNLSATTAMPPLIKCLVLYAYFFCRALTYTMRWITTRD